MRKFYVTKKQVECFIDQKITQFKMSKEDLIAYVISTLTILSEYPNDNKVQIKFYKRVSEYLN